MVWPSDQQADYTTNKTYITTYREALAEAGPINIQI